jgi:hypothetical protein
VKTIKLKIPEPHSIGQAEVLDWPGHGVLFAGRRWGKTQIATVRLLQACIANPALYWWVGLSWRSASMKRAWRVLKGYTRELWRSMGSNPASYIREADKELSLPGGASIWLRTAENPSSLVGEGLAGVVIDEFSLMPETVWSECIAPSLLDLGGWSLHMGVPKGRNWAVHLYEQAQTRPGWKTWTFTTYDNPFLDRAAIDEIRDHTPERLFRQEYLAEVTDDAGLVFRHVAEAATAVNQDAALPGHVYVVGVDWARTYDATVFAVVDVTLRSLVYVDRMTKVDYPLQMQRLRGLYERFGPSKIVAEANAMGLPLIEQLQRYDLPVVPFVTTANTKQTVVDALVLAFEQGSIRIIPDADLIAELQAYEFTETAAGNVRYGAPAGEHDDLVIALALAWYAGVGTRQYEPPRSVSYLGR